MSETNSVPADDLLARQLTRLAPGVEMDASRAAFDSARRPGRSNGNGDGPRWWLAAAVVLLVATGVVGVWAIRGDDPADDPADVPAVATDPPADDPTTDLNESVTATGVTVPLPPVGAPALHNTSAGLVWVVAHADGTVSVLPATLDGNISSEDTTVTNLRSLVRASSSGDSFSGDVGHWDDHGRAITVDRDDDLTGYTGRVAGEEVEILPSTGTRIPGDPDANLYERLAGEEYPIPDFGEPIDVMTFMTLSSSGPVWRHLDASLVVEDGVGRICEAPTAVPVDELVGCGDGVALDTQVRSTTPEITTWFHPPILAFQDPLEGFTHVIPLAGYSSRAKDDRTVAAGVLALPPADPIEFLAIGDSVMLGAAGELASRGYTVDALASRQLDDVVPRVRALVQQGLVGDTPIVIHLGNNGPIAESDLDVMLEVLAEQHQVVLLTSHADRGWIDRNNDLIQNADLRPNVVVVDWNDRARRCGEACFAADGMHLSATGVQHYADTIREVVGR